jgi:hypothetical protein
MAKTKNSSARRERPRAGERRLKLAAERDKGHSGRPEHYIDRLLDDALEQTFPASDAIAVVLTGGR